ncbi:MAG: ETX/MTX2 family pore-forming toxin [Archangium sp.]
MNDIQKITDTWGNWIAAQRGTSCRFTASTNYGEQSDLSAYTQYQCSVTVEDIAYDGNSPPTNGSTVAYELWYDNGTSLQQSETFNYSATSQQTFNWSITEALSIGVEVSATEGVPSVASSTQKVTVNLSFSSTQGASSSNTQNWSVNTPVQVPPEQSVKCDMVINEQSYDINFTETVLIKGYVAIWFNDKQDWNNNGDYHWLWFIPITEVFSDVINNKLIDTTGYVITGGGVQATAQGTFTGSQGVSVGVTTTQYPLRSSASAKDFKPIKKSTAYSKLIAGAA